MTDVKVTEADRKAAIATARAEGTASRRLKFEWKEVRRGVFACVAVGRVHGHVFNHGDWRAALNDRTLNNGNPFPDEPTARKAVEDAVQA